MASATRNVMDNSLNDPVTKAVVDNIMGNLPTKKPPVRCVDCDLCFTSQTVLECHLQGSRHAKQIRSKTIMASLEETKVAFSKDQEANSLKCNVCNVCLNSIQQLQTHLNGNRHKKKAMKGGWTGTEVTQGSSVGSASTVTSVKIVASAKPSNPAASTKSSNSNVNKGVTFSCDVCNKFFNSKTQYDVHISSKKHSDRLNRGAAKNPKKKRFFPYWKKSKALENADAQIPIPSLANNFVSGGYNS
ncbi:zinc finger protein 346-like [Venturia canescens]|uniref:zinc finger protein 346-like n=1 Tax=Venturia canescens TaxID=32260 RepID=UPI001C9C5501|nr:zinc finger protein 346-like [Venturia canescens]